MDKSGQSQILARDGLSVNDPKRTSLISNAVFVCVAETCSLPAAEPNEIAKTVTKMRR